MRRSFTRREVVLSLLSLGLAAACSRGRSGSKEPLGVAVASSFAGPMQELGALYTRETGHELSVSTGSTGTLYAQIVNGAPFDVFLAADSERPAELERSGHGVAGTRFTYALGRLALYGPGLAHPDDGLVDLESGALRRLAIANPEIAPYGRAARQVLEKIGLFAELEPRIVRGENITQAQQFVDNGGAELGFVALGAVRVGARFAHWPVPASLHAPIRQQAILLERGAGSADAKALLELLKGPAGRAVIEGAGYGTESA